MTSLVAGLHEHVANLLDALGDGAEAVATSLRTEEVRGVRGSALAHPVCRWLVRLVPDLGAVLGPDTVQVFRPGREVALHRAIVPLPPPVRAFADRFDEGHHPELELCLAPPSLMPVPQLPVGRRRPDPARDTLRLPAVRAPASPVIVDGEVVGDRAGLAGEDVPGGELLRFQRPVARHRHLTVDQSGPAG